MKKQSRTVASILFLLCSLIFLGGCRTTEVSLGDNPKARRDEILKLGKKGNSAIPSITAALEDENAIVRSTAIRLLAEKGMLAADELKKALNNKDEMVRLRAIQSLCLLFGKETPVELLAKAGRDKSQFVRLAAISSLAAWKPVKGRKLELLTELAKEEKVAALRTMAFNAIWPFYRNVVLLRNRADWDHDVKVIQEMVLPKEDWAFQTDNKNLGHTLNWFEPAFDDSKWKRIPIENTWESAGVVYDGYAWYRKTFKAPPKPAKFNAAELKFDAVDECAWVWLNGVYVGEHNLGISGWAIPFSQDVTKEIKWGEENQITVRVHDEAQVGGIYKPVRLQVME